MENDSDTPSPNRPVAPSPHLPVSSSHWRVFCAAELPDHVRAKMRDYIGRLRDSVPGASASWSRPENVHLTLKFFGDVAQDRIPKISAAISRAVNTGSPLQIRVGGCGVFPKPSQARVLWIGVNDASGKLAGLQQRVEEECAEEGFEKEDRAFRPHLTIARIRKPDGARQLAEAHLQLKFELLEGVAQELVLFRSELSNKGSLYTPISRHRMSDKLQFVVDVPK